MKKTEAKNGFISPLEIIEAGSFEEIEDQRSRWNELAQLLDSPVYMSFEWCRVWWENYGAGKELRLFLFYYNSRLVGIVPLYLDCPGVFPFQARIVRIVGSPVPPRVFNPPVMPDTAELVFDALLDRVFRSWNADVMSFGSCSDSYEPGNVLLERCHAHGDLIGKASKALMGVQAVLDLPDSMDDYISSLSRNRRKTIRREMRNLEEKGYKVEELSGSEDLEGRFRDFREMHARQWEAQGQLGHFRSWPGAEKFHEDLVAALLPTQRLSLIMAWYDGIPASYLYSYYFGNNTFAELGARTLDQRLQWCSIGTHILVEQLRMSVEKGNRAVHLGPAHYDYKRGLGAAEQEIYNTRIVSARWKSRIMYRCLLLIRWLLNTGYYKVWYRRIQPWLSQRFRRPIWWSWIRTNI